MVVQATQAGNGIYAPFSATETITVNSVGALAGQSDNPATLHVFGNGSVVNDGTGAYGGGVIQAADGNFYGTTWYGGTASDGVVYKITPQGQLTILHSFGDGSVANDGNGNQGASSLVQGSDGNFYGTTVGGGSAGKGAVYKVTPTGTVTILHSFADGSVNKDGTEPFAPLIQGADGNFYGTRSRADRAQTMVWPIKSARTVLIRFCITSAPERRMMRKIHRWHCCWRQTVISTVGS